MYYLKRKFMGTLFPSQMMSDVDVYQYAPWDLPHQACLKTRELYWYFFCPLVKKYPSGARAHRLTEFGYLKSTGTDRTVKYHGCPVGKIKTLVFHRGKPPGGDRANWVMHESGLTTNVLLTKASHRTRMLFARYMKRVASVRKNGEHYGAPFVEEEWESDDDTNLQNDQGALVLLGSVVPAPADDMNALSTPGSLAPSPTEQLTPCVTAGWTPSITASLTPSVTSDWTPSTTTEETIPVTEQLPTESQPAPVNEQVPTDKPLAADNGLGHLVDNDFLFMVFQIWTSMDV